MPEPITLALDAMGGDNSPHSVIEGADLALLEHSHLFFRIFGAEKQILPLLDAYPKVKKASTLIPTDEKILSDEKPSAAIRRKNTSMRLAVESVKAGDAHGVVSSGNTGAYMALSKIILRPIPGIQRPAITTIFPTERTASVMLDMGANIVCDAEHLMQFAIMGSIYAKEVLQVKKPSVGLLNVGEEELKGHAYIQEAAQLLKQLPDIINFHGFIEGDDVSKGTVDVVITDGFTGNVCIKTAEGIAHLIFNYLKKSAESSLISKIGFLLARPALRKLKNFMDPNSYNGAMFIGLNGVAIKSHGGATSPAFANAISVATQMISHDFTKQIEQDLLAANKILG